MNYDQYQLLITAIAEDIKASCDEHGLPGSSSMAEIYLENLSADVLEKLNFD